MSNDAKTLDGDPCAALRRLAISVDDALGSLRLETADGALDLWMGLVDARWSLVDHFVYEGRRYTVARRNAVPLAPRAALTARERLVVAHAVVGRSMKAIGYELGLAPSTISAHLRGAMRKLRVRTRAELARVLSPPMP